MRINKFFEIIYIFVVVFLFTASPVVASSAYIPNIVLNSTLSTNPNQIINSILIFGFIVIGFTFFIVIIIGGIEWMVSSGDDQKRDGAKDRLVNAVIGITIVAGSYLIVEIVGSLFGVSSIFFQNLFTNKCPNSSGAIICLNK